MTLNLNVFSSTGESITVTISPLRQVLQSLDSRNLWPEVDDVSLGKNTEDSSGSDWEAESSTPVLTVTAGAAAANSSSSPPHHHKTTTLPEDFLFDLRRALTQTKGTRVPLVLSVKEGVALLEAMIYSIGKNPIRRRIVRETSKWFIHGLIKGSRPDIEVSKLLTGIRRELGKRWGSLKMRQKRLALFNINGQTYANQFVLALAAFLKNPDSDFTEEMQDVAEPTPKSEKREVIAAPPAVKALVKEEQQRVRDALAQAPEFLGFSKKSEISNLDHLVPGDKVDYYSDSKKQWVENVTFFGWKIDPKGPPRSRLAKLSCKDSANPRNIRLRK